MFGTGDSGGVVLRGVVFGGFFGRVLRRVSPAAAFFPRGVRRAAALDTGLCLRTGVSFALVRRRLRLASTKRRRRTFVRVGAAAFRGGDFAWSPCVRGARPICGGAANRVGFACSERVRLSLVRTESKSIITYVSSAVSLRIFSKSFHDSTIFDVNLRRTSSTYLSRDKHSMRGEIRTRYRQRCVKDAPEMQVEGLQGKKYVGDGGDGRP